MAKRFTDTDKWKRPWFTDLDPKTKLTWLYLLDNCDHAGIWPANFSLAAFCLGFKIDEIFILNNLGDKVEKISEDKFWIRSFFEFQYGSSNSGFKAKASAINMLQRHGLCDNFGNLKLSLSEQLPNCTSKSIGKSIGKSKSKINTATLDFESVYAKYPRKEGKAAGLRVCKNAIKTPEALLQLHKAIDRYVGHLKVTNTEPRFIKHFSTFMNSWEDWCDESTGSTDNFKPSMKIEDILARKKKMVEEELSDQT